MEPPSLPALDRLTAILEARRAAEEAWLVGWLNRRDERTDSAIAFVVDEPRRASSRPELLALIEELTPVTSDLGLTVTRWAFVPPVAVERRIGSCGVRIAKAR